MYLFIYFLRFLAFAESRVKVNAVSKMVTDVYTLIQYIVSYLIPTAELR